MEYPERMTCGDVIIDELPNALPWRHEPTTLPTDYIWIGFGSEPIKTSRIHQSDWIIQDVHAQIWFKMGFLDIIYVFANACLVSGADLFVFPADQIIPDSTHLGSLRSRD